jgi:hypothetical protein
MIEPVDLQTLAAGKYRTNWDPAAAEERCRDERRWLVRIPCRGGSFISVHGPTNLAAYATGRVARRLVQLDGVTPHQIGDHEARVLFPPDQLDAIAKVLGARRCRRLTDGQRERLVAAGQRSRFSRRTDRVPAAT